MKIPTVSKMVLTLLLIGTLTLAFNTQSVRAEGVAIYIGADGSVEPTTAPISTIDNITYTFTDSIYDSIVVERNNIVIDGNGYAVQGSGAVNSRGIDLTGRTNVTVRNTQIKGWYFGIYVFSSSSNIIVRNNITSNSYGIELIANFSVYSNYNRIIGNNMKYNTYAMWFNPRSNYNIIIGNNVTNSGTGIAIIQSNHNSIIGNNVAGNYHGVWLLSSSLSSIIANNIKHNTRGIEFNTASNNTVIGNSIAYNGDGIELWNASDYNNITGNKITNNGGGGGSGIDLYWMSKYNSIIGNTIAGNGVGIDVYDFLGNRIYHNNFIKNRQQAFVGLQSPPFNAWDNGYPSGGNYWSDYTGIDSNYDGIGDTIYVIDANNQDWYPLINPWNYTPPVANAGSDQMVQEDTLVSFDGSGSSDNIGIETYTWTFIDVTPKTLTGMNPTYVFTTPGVYAVTLNVTDGTGNWAADMVTITVLKLTPEELLQRLTEKIEAWGLPIGTAASLKSKLEDALHLLDIGNENGAIHKLMDFISQVGALQGKKLTDEQANYLTYQAQKTIDRIKE